MTKRAFMTSAFMTSVSLLALLSGSALAADFPVKAARPAPLPDMWSGFYIGLGYGAGAGSARTSFTDARTQTFRQTVPGTTVTQVFTDVGSGSLSGHVTGAMVDLFAGYNVRVAPSFILGGQIEGTVFSDVTLKTTGQRIANQLQTTTTVVGGVTTVTTATANSNDTSDSHDELRSMVSFVGRAGWLAGDKTLLYALGGGALGHFVVPDDFNARGGDRNKWVLGYTAGAGVEHKITPHWSLRAEYRYLHFDIDRSQSSLDTQTQVQGATTFTNVNAFTRDGSTSFESHIGKIALVYTPWATPTGPFASMPARDAMAAVPDMWSGFYFGVGYGAGAGPARSSVSETQTQTFRQTVPGTTVTQVFTDVGSGSLSGHVTGSMADVFAGYNFRVAPSFILGGQIEGTVFSDVNLKTMGQQFSNQTQTTTTVTGGVTTVTTAAASGNATTESHDELRSMVSFVGRAGWLAGERTLLYALGGGALGHFVVPSDFDPFGGERSKWVLGYTAGAGVEHKITPHWSLRAEYRYLNFDVDRSRSTFTSQTQVQAATTFTNVNSFAGDSSTSFESHIGKIALVYTPWATPAGPFASMPARDAMAAIPDVWTGFYFGAGYGAGAGPARSSISDSQTQTFRQTVPGTTVTQVFTDVGSGSSSGDATGSMVDIFAGYNIRVAPTFVLGGQIEGTVFSDVNLKSSGQRLANQTQTTTTVAGGVTTVTTSTGSSSGTFDNLDELRSMVSFVGRAGWLAGENTLLYALGGGALGHFVVPGDFDPRGGQRNKWVLGYTAGAGVEHRITPHWSLRAEYRYLHFDVDRSRSSFDSQTQVQAATTFSSSNSFARDTSTSFDSHIGKIALVYTPWASGTDAFAASMPLKAVPPRPVDMWAGFHFGVAYGAGAGPADTSLSDAQTQTFRQTVPGTTVTQVSTEVGSGSLSGDVTGSTVDLFAGYNLRVAPSFIIGGQIEGTVFSDVALKTSGQRFSNETLTTTTVVGAVTTVTTATSSGLGTSDNVDELRSMVSLIGRAGWLAGERTLLYALGGGAAGHFVVPDDFNLRGGDRNKWVLGYTAGAGVEHKFTPNWSLRAEYRYLHFDVDRSGSSFDSQTQAQGTTTFTNVNSFTRDTSTSFDSHIGKIAVVYRP